MGIVKNLETPQGNTAKNQFRISTDTGSMFQSYNTICAVLHNGKIYTEEGLYNYSPTTKKFFNQFIYADNKTDIKKYKNVEVVDNLKTFINNNNIKITL